MPTVPDELQPEFILTAYETSHDVDGALAEFFSPLPNLENGVNVKYDVYEYQRGLGHLVGRNSPPDRRDMPKRSTVNYEAVTMKDAVEIPPALKDYRGVGQQGTRTRQDGVTRATRQLRSYHDTRREWLRAQWLTGGALLSDAGAVPGDADGVVYLDHGARAASNPIPVTLGIDDDHINATVPNGTSWANSTANIRNDLQHAAQLLEEDAGVDRGDIVVIMNETAMEYLMTNLDVVNNASEELKRQREKFGRLAELWGFEFMEYNTRWQIDTETMNDAAGMEYYIPDNVVVVTTRNNEAAGRAMLECSPSDENAPAGARGAYAWTDQDEVHPHAVAPGVEWNGGPMLGITDSVKIFKDVTAV